MKKTFWHRDLWPPETGPKMRKLTKNYFLDLKYIMVYLYVKNINLSLKNVISKLRFVVAKWLLSAEFLGEAKCFTNFLS